MNFRARAISLLASAAIGALAVAGAMEKAWPQGVVAGPIYQPGEIQKSTVLIGSAVTLTTTATPYNLTSITLNPGVWSISGNVLVTGAGTTFPILAAAFNTISATLPNPPSGAYAQGFISSGTTGGGLSTRSYNVNITVPTTFYFVVQANFTGTAPTAYGEVSAIRIQ